MNLVSEWKLDEGTGTTTHDSWGTNNGTLTNNPTWVTSGCVSGNCLSFDGTDDYVDCGNGSSLNISDNTITISAWAKRSTLSSTQRIVHKGGQGNVFLDYNLTFGAANVVYFGANKTTSTINSVSTTNTFISTSAWYYIVGTWDGSSYKIYINGTSEVVGVAEAVTNTNNNNFQIGQRNDNQQRFNGLIDDVKIYNQALSTSEIKQNYYSGINKLYKNKGIVLNEFNQRIIGLKNNLANY
jgi:hypothetical protein